MCVFEFFRVLIERDKVEVHENTSFPPFPPLPPSRKKRTTIALGGIENGFFLARLFFCFFFFKSCLIICSTINPHKPSLPFFSYQPQTKSHSRRKETLQTAHEGEKIPHESISISFNFFFEILRPRCILDT